MLQNDGTEYNVSDIIFGVSWLILIYRKQYWNLYYYYTHERKIFIHVAIVMVQIGKMYGIFTNYR